MYFSFDKHSSEILMNLYRKFIYPPNKLQTHTWTDVDLNLWHHTGLPSRNELNTYLRMSIYQWFGCESRPKQVIHYVSTFVIVKYS